MPKIIFDPLPVRSEMDLSRIPHHIASEMLGHPIYDIVNDLLEVFDYYLEAYPNVFELSRYPTLLFNARMPDVERRYDIITGCPIDLSSDDWILLCEAGIIRSEMEPSIPLHFIPLMNLSYPTSIHQTKHAYITDDIIYLCRKAARFTPEIVRETIPLLQDSYEREVAIQYDPDVVFNTIAELLQHDDPKIAVGIDEQFMTIVSPSVDYILDAYMSYLINKNIDCRQFPDDYSDQEIFSKLGIQICYRFRDELLRLINGILNNTPSIFIINHLDNIKPRNSILSLTLEPLHQSKSQLIGMGTLNDCFVTSFNDLIEAAESSMINHLPYLYSPETGQPLCDQDVKIIKKYAKILCQTKFLDVCAKLDTNAVLCHQSDTYLKDRYYALVYTDRASIKEFILTVFYTGMYMRRWSPGQPFPYTKASTKISNIHYLDIDPCFIENIETPYYTENNPHIHAQVSKHLQLLTDQYTQATLAVKDLINIIPQCELSISLPNNCKVYNIPFWSTIAHQVITAKECFRIASTYFIGTSYRFFIIINDIPPDIQNFNISAIESIT